VWKETMAHRKRRQPAFQFEALEERLTLSTMSGGTYELVSQVAAERTSGPRHQKISANFTATGQAVPSKIIDNPDGSFTVTANITGTAQAKGKKTTLSSAFGSFSGTLSGTTGSTSDSTVINFKKGSENVSLTGHGTLVTQGSDSGTFTITGGSGAFANATGGGSYTASVTGQGTPNPMLTFQFTGKVTVVR
jgi:hypothetical protein